MTKSLNKLEDSYESPILSGLFNQRQNIIAKEWIDKWKTQNSSPKWMQSFSNNGIFN